MKTINAKFIVSAQNLEQSPNLNLPEFALIGRSNVGKSTFINGLANHNKLAKTSNTPGKTRLINFFDFDGKYTIVDLPGYGYAAVSGDMQRDWQKNLEHYLLNRKELVCLIQFIDSRHAIQKNDYKMREWIKFNNLHSIIIATKIDCIGRSKIVQTTEYMKKELDAEVYAFSKNNKFYNEKILQALNTMSSKQWIKPE